MPPKNLVKEHQKLRYNLPMVLHLATVFFAVQQYSLHDKALTFPVSANVMT